MRTWKKKEGAPPRPPRVRICEESAPLLKRLADVMKREPEAVIHLALRLLAASLNVKMEQLRTKGKTRRGPIAAAPVAATARRMMRNAQKGQRNEQSKR